MERTARAVPEWLEHSRLWLVLDRLAAAPRSLPEVTRLAISGGVDVVLCRLKELPTEEAAVLAKPVRELCRDIDVPFVMSHFPELAAELEADAVQLGVADPGINEIRLIVGPGVPIGCSTHSVVEAQRRFADGAAYVFLGPVYPTPAKLKYGAPLGLDVIAAASKLPGPVVFIGGIDAQNVSPIIAAGGMRVAAISALQRCPDPTRAASTLKSLLPVD